MMSHEESSTSIVVEMGDEEDPNIGRVLNGRYRLASRLGVGGYGIVYQGVYLKDNQEVAIKMLRPAEDHDQEVRARFRREGEALSNLQSKHTVRTYEFNYDEEGSMFIVMELLHGRTLKEELRKLGKLPWKRGLTILTQICDALTEAHASGYVHRDLKPENIYLCAQPAGQDDIAKVLDFGIAKKLQLHGHQQDGDTQLTAHGQTVGTMRYMSPEQLLGQNVDSRSDIYSLGVLTCRMITGRVPFPKAKNMARLIAAQLQQTPRVLSQMSPKAGIPGDLDFMVSLMLEKTAGLRPPNTEVLRIACQEILETGSWSSADRYRKKSAKDEEEDDPTAKAAAVNPMELASMLDDDGQAQLAAITGHNLPRPDLSKLRDSDEGDSDKGATDKVQVALDLDSTELLDAATVPQKFSIAPIPNNQDFDLDSLSVKSGSGMLWFLLFVVLAGVGVFAYILLAR